MFKHQAKKSLGQNFLTSQSIVDQIVASGQVAATDTVLEIGPGKGILTRRLLETGATVVAVEKDDQLFEYLQNTFQAYLESGKLVLCHGDILEILELAVPKSPYKLIANIPYYITGKIISTFLESPHKPTTIVLMVQYEVAQRITSSIEHSILSLSVWAYGVPKLVRRVPAGAFHPRPKVDSAILAISAISANFFVKNSITEAQFFRVVKAGFAHKRKKLMSTLKNVFVGTPWIPIFEGLSLSPNTRAEDLSLETWGILTTKSFSK